MSISRAAAERVEARQADPYTIIDDLVGQIARPAADWQSARIDHLGIAVRSLDRALTFYERSARARFRLSRNGSPEKGERRHAPGRAAPASNCWRPPAPDSVIAKFIGKRGEGCIMSRSR